MKIIDINNFLKVYVVDKHSPKCSLYFYFIEAVT